MNNRRFLYRDAGGEVGELIQEIEGETWECPACGYDLVVGGLDAYKHDGGLEDDDGTKWWTYIECPECEYEDSIGKANPL